MADNIVGMAIQRIDKTISDILATLTQHDNRIGRIERVMSSEEVPTNSQNRFSFDSFVSSEVAPSFFLAE